MYLVFISMLWVLASCSTKGDSPDMSSSSNDSPLPLSSSAVAVSSSAIVAISSSSAVAISSSSEAEISSSSWVTGSSSSSTTGPQVCTEYELTYCGGLAYDSVPSNSTTVPTTGECLFIGDFEQIQPSLNSTVAINGLEISLGDTWDGADSTIVKEGNKKPAKKDGGYYVYVKLGGINTYQDNGWKNIVAKEKPNCGAVQSSSSRVAASSSSRVAASSSSRAVSSSSVVVASSSSRAASSASVVPSSVFGDNPIVQTSFTADPAPVVFKDSRYSDRLFVYTSNDDPNATWFEMSNLMCYSTTDMVNWTDHGAVMSDVHFKWAKAKTFWASQVIDRNGKFYAYVPIEIDGKGPQIGVGVSDSPYGPFTDAIGKPLVSGSWAGDIDPSVFIDDDGQAYLYWGNPDLKYAKLKSNMIELDGSVVKVPMTAASFGARSKTEEGRPTSYEEGPWFYKRNVSGLANPYYLVYAGGPISEHLAYATASKATGPWTYGGVIMPTANGLAFTNHPGVIDFKGKSYLFYHDQQLKALEGYTGGYTRSVSVAAFAYGANGSIPKVSPSLTGPAAVAVLNPYSKTHATTINYSSKVKTRRKDTSNRNALEMTVYDIRNDGYIRIKAVDFGSEGATSFMANIACGSANTKIEIRVGGTNATNSRLVGTMNVANNGWNTWREQKATLERITGIQDVYLVFKGSGTSELLRMEYWQFE